MNMEELEGKGEKYLTQKMVEFIFDSIGKPVEYKLETDADESNVISFSEEIWALEINHNGDTRQIFTLDGVDIPVASGGYRFRLEELHGYTGSNEITIPGGINCIIARLI